MSAADALKGFEPTEYLTEGGKAQWRERAAQAVITHLAAWPKVSPAFETTREAQDWLAAHATERVKATSTATNAVTGEDQRHEVLANVVALPTGVLALAEEIGSHVAAEYEDDPELDRLILQLRAASQERTENGTVVTPAVVETERRITYSYGVNRDQTRTGFASYEWLEQQVERDTYGPVDVTKRESRAVTYGNWEADEPAQSMADQYEVDRHAEKQGVSYADAWRYFEIHGYDMSGVDPQYG